MIKVKCPGIRKSYLKIKGTPLLFLTILVSVLGLSACSQIIGGGQTTTGTLISLTPGKTLGQTFVSRQDGLTGLMIILSPKISGDGDVWLRLRSDPQSTNDIASAHIPLQTITTARYYNFQIPVQTRSRGLYYYFVLNIQGQGVVDIDSAQGDTYLDGALYNNGYPADAQMGFQQVFDPAQAYLGIGRQFISWFGVLIVGIFLFILPGWALLSWLFPFWDELSWAEKLGLAGGISLAVYPLLLLWTNLVGLNLGGFYAWVPPLLGIIAIVWKFIATHKKTQMGSKQFRVRLDFVDVVFIIVLGLIIFTRFWPVHDLDAPLWGDSYQHTLIAQLIVNHGGLFNSWRPYAELSTFTYHFGFHAAVAVFHWMTQLSLPKSVLWTGQLINVLAVLSLYPLAVKIGKNRWAGIIAIMVAGLISSMPMFYLNWGRYTQLAGQVVLLASVFMAWVYLEQKTHDWRLVGLIWVAWGGLALTHYRIFILAILFFIAYFILEIRKQSMASLFVKTFWSAIGVIVLFMPWFIHVFGGKLVQILTHQLSTPLNSLTGSIEQTNSVGSWFTYLPALLWLILPICIGWGLWKHNKGIALIGLWWFLIFLAGNPQWLHLPGSSVITGFAVIIAAYIPAGLLIGGVAGTAYEEMKTAFQKSRVFENRHSILAAALFTIGIFSLVSVWEARQRLGDVVVSTFSLVTRPDLRAFEWIKANTPDDATFLVNSFLAYNQSSAVGSDGGWWLPLLTQRKSTLPPLNYSSEQGYDPNLQTSVKDLSIAVTENGADNPEVLSQLNNLGVSYIYIGQQQGKVNNPGPVIDPIKLENNPHFTPVYHQDRVWVFKILP